MAAISFSSSRTWYGYSLQEWLLFCIPLALLVHGYLWELLAWGYILLILVHKGARAFQDIWTGLEKSMQISLGLLFVGALVSIVVDPNSEVALTSVIEWVVTPALVIMATLASESDSQPFQIGILVYGVLLTIYGVTLMGVQAQNRLGTGVLSVHEYAMVASSALALALVMAPKHMVYRLVSIVLGVGLVLVHSMSGFLGISCMVGYYIFTNSKLEKLFKMYLAMGLVLIVGVLGYLIFSKTGSLHDQYATWRVSKYLLESYPLTGIGIEGFSHNYFAVAKDVYYLPLSPIPVTAGLLPVDIWLSLGMAGFLGVVGVVWELIRAKASNPRLLPLFVLVGAGFVGLNSFSTPVILLAWLYGLFCLEGEK